jgi:CheY-like chemotaxis protein
MRRRGLKMPTIALTAYSIAEDRVQCLACGCDDHPGKPVKEEILLSTVDQRLGHNRSPAPGNGDGGGAVELPLLGKTADGSTMIRTSEAGNPRTQKIIPEFVYGLPGEVRKMIDLLDHNDLPALQRIVQQLRGSSGGYGFDPIGTLANAEESIKANKAVEVISADTNSLIEMIRHIEGCDESKAKIAEVPAK